MKTTANQTSKTQVSAEQVTQAGLQLLPLIMSNIPQAIFWKDRDLVYLGCNQAFADDAGFSSPQEIIGKTDFDMPWKDQAELYRSDDQLVMEKGEPKLNYEEPQTTPNGTTIWLSTSKIPVHQNGQVVAVLGMYEDITPRKQSEILVQESRARFQALVETLSDWIWEVDQNGVYTYVSPKVKDLLGYEPEEVLGKTPFDLMPPEEAQRVAGVFGPLLSAQQPLVALENTNRHKDGHLVVFETSGVPVFDAAGSFKGYRGTDRDIAERKQAEKTLRESQQLLQTVMDNIPQSIFWKDRNLTYLGCNRAFAEDAGLASPSDILGKNDWDMPWKEQAELYRADDSLVMKNGVPKLNYEEPQTTPDGSTIWLRTSKVPLRDSDGNVSAVLGMYEDVTERKRLEQQIQTALERRGLQVQLSTQVSQSIAAASSLEELYKRVVTQVKEQFGYYHTQILRYDADQDAVVLVTGYGEIGAKMLAAGHRLARGEGLIGTAAATGETVLRPELKNDPDWQPNPLLPGTTGEIAVPIKLGDNVLGVLDVQSDIAGALNPEDQLLLEGLCGQIAIAIESTRLRQEMAERLEEINRLYQAMRQEGWEAYQRSDQLPGGFMFDRAGVVPVEAASPLQEDFLDIPIVLPGGQVIGTVGVADDPRRPLSPEERDLLGQISEQIALAMESARLFDQTQAALAQSEKLFEASRRLTQAQNLQELTASTVSLLGMKEINRALLVTFNYDADNNVDTLEVAANWWNGYGHAVTPIGSRYTKDVIRVMPMFISSVPVFFDDTSTDPRVDATTMELVKKLNLRAVAVLPLHIGLHQVGALILEAEEPHNFTEEETRLFAALAPQISTVLENRRQYERAQKQAERESMLNTISQKIQSATTVEAVLQIAARELGHALGAPLTIAQLGIKAQGNGN